jgi:SOS response regulatory protein OraA/RecX
VIGSYMSKEALSYLYRIISRKDYTEYEIREKLHFRFNLEENAIDSLID